MVARFVFAILLVLSVNVVIAADGKLLHVLGNGTPGKGVNRFRTPEGVEVRGSKLWLSDSGNDRIVKYTLYQN